MKFVKLFILIIFYSNCLAQKNKAEGITQAIESFSTQTCLSIIRKNFNIGEKYLENVKSFEYRSTFYKTNYRYLDFGRQISLEECCCDSVINEFKVNLDFLKSDYQYQNVWLTRKMSLRQILNHYGQHPTFVQLDTFNEDERGNNPEKAILILYYNSYGFKNTSYQFYFHIDDKLTLDKIPKLKAANFIYEEKEDQEKIFKIGDTILAKYFVAIYVPWDNSKTDQ